MDCRWRFFPVLERSAYRFCTLNNIKMFKKKKKRVKSYAITQGSTRMPGFFYYL